MFTVMFLNKTSMMMMVNMVIMIVMMMSVVMMVMTDTEGKFLFWPAVRFGQLLIFQ